MSALSLGGHLKFAALGTGLGTAALTATRALAPAPWIAPLLGGVGLACTATVPAGLGLSLLARHARAASKQGDLTWTFALQALARVAPSLAAALQAPGRRLAALVGVSVGVAAAPLASGASLAAAAAYGSTSLLTLHAHGQWQRQDALGLGLGDMALLAGQLGAAGLPWSLAAGVTVSVALGTAAALGVGGLATLLLLRFHVHNRGQRQLTAYADAHQVPPAEVARYRADCLGEPSPTVRHVPPRVVEKLAEAQALLRRDAKGMPYWLGLPILALEGPPGTGKTSLACAMAEKLGADLLATSASQLKRVYLPGLPVGLVRFVTLLAQAELRAIRTRRLQLLFVDEAASLFARQLDISSPEGLREVRALLTMTAQLSLHSARRNGVMLVLADNHLQASKDALMSVTPHPPVQLAPPDAATLQRLLAAKVAPMLVRFAATWRLPPLALAPSDPAYAALAAQVGQLSRLGGTGRDVTGVVARMRRAGEAKLHGSQPYNGAAWLAAMVAEGRRAAAAYATRWPPVRPAPGLFVAVPGGYASDDAHQYLRQLVREAVGDPLTLLTSFGEQEASRTLNVGQTLDQARIARAYETSVAAVRDRVQSKAGVDAPSHAKYLSALATLVGHARVEDDPLASARLAQLWPERHARALGQSPGRRPAPNIFADTPFPCLEWMALEAAQDALLSPFAAQYRAYKEDKDNPYAHVHPALQTWYKMRQRNDGLRVDVYRSEWAYDLYDGQASTYRRETQRAQDRAPSDAR